MNRGISLWNGSRDEVSPDNPLRWLADLVYEAIGAEKVWSDGYHLKGINITIEIEQASKQ